MSSPRLSYLYGFVILALTSNYCVMAKSSSQAIKGAYYPSWAIDFPPSSIDTTLFTHIYYSFLNPNNITFKFDITDSLAVALLNFTSTLHAKKPPVKTLFSIGGALASTTIFSNMVSNANSRKSFICSSIEVARKFGFDGIDLDWESPKNPKEMEDFGSLLHEWRAEVKKEARETGQSPLLLTAATYFAVDFFLDAIYRKYPVDSISKNLDWINAMCYDYHGSWDTSSTGSHAALYDPKSNVSTSYGLGSWARAGLPRSKLIMGLPLYGRTWKLKDPKLHFIGAPGISVGPGNGDMSYLRVEKFNKENNATVVFDLETVSTYSYVGSSWIGYDDVRSASAKIVYAREQGIRGYFFWAVNGDLNWKISRQASKMWIH